MPPNHGINAEAEQLVSLKVFREFTFSVFDNGSGMFGPGYAKRYVHKLDKATQYGKQEIRGIS